MPLIKDVTSVDRMYPSGSTSRRTVACKLSDVLFVIAQRIGIDLVRQHLTDSLRVFFAVFTVTSPSPGQPAAEVVASSSSLVQAESERRQSDAAGKGIVLFTVACMN